MIVQIIIKWATDWSEIDDPPSIITNMINMALDFGSIGDQESLWNNKTG